MAHVLQAPTTAYRYEIVHPQVIKKVSEYTYTINNTLAIRFY